MRDALSMPEFCSVVRQVIDDLPAELQPRLENLIVDVENWPSPQLAAQLKLRERNVDLLGVFIGRGLLNQEHNEHPLNRIVIFKEPIEMRCRNVREVAQQIRHTVLHELAHHFGFSEEDLESFESRPMPWDGPEQTGRADGP